MDFSSCVKMVGFPKYSHIYSVYGTRCTVVILLSEITPHVTTDTKYIHKKKNHFKGFHRDGQKWQSIKKH